MDLDSLKFSVLVAIAISTINIKTCSGDISSRTQNSTKLAIITAEVSE